jgi:hypothetical protein
MSLMKSVLLRAGQLKRRVQQVEARMFNSRRAPELTRAYAAFRRQNQSGSPRQPFKGRDLWKLLDRHRPSSIVELGSGTTSAVFALWAREHRARYTAYEHHEGWAAVTENCLREAGLRDDSSRIAVVPSRVGARSESTGFVEPLPLDSDFIYVDGPPCKLDSGKKVPNDDVVRLFEAGGRPGTIVVDGRFETVDLIRQHPVGSTYEFQPSSDYCVHNAQWMRAIRGGEHTVFRRVSRDRP